MDEDKRLYNADGSSRLVEVKLNVQEANVVIKALLMGFDHDGLETRKWIAQRIAGKIKSSRDS
jgi:hypothetical protein